MLPRDTTVMTEGKIWVVKSRSEVRIAVPSAKLLLDWLWRSVLNKLIPETDNLKRKCSLVLHTRTMWGVCFWENGRTRIYELTWKAAYFLSCGP